MEIKIDNQRSVTVTSLSFGVTTLTPVTANELDELDVLLCFMHSEHLTAEAMLAALSKRGYVVMKISEKESNGAS